MYCLLCYARDQVSKQGKTFGKPIKDQKKRKDVRTGGSAMNGEHELSYDGLEPLEEDHERDVQHSSHVLRFGQQTRTKGRRPPTGRRQRKEQRRTSSCRDGTSSKQRCEWCLDKKGQWSFVLMAGERKERRDETRFSKSKK